MGRRCDAITILIMMFASSPRRTIGLQVTLGMVLDIIYKPASLLN